MSLSTTGVRLNDMRADLAVFRDADPAYHTTDELDALRTSEYRRLDQDAQLYLDDTDGSVYTDSQLKQHLDLLRQNVFGNPHATNPTSHATRRVCGGVGTRSGAALLDTPQRMTHGWCVGADAVDRAR